MARSGNRIISQSYAELNQTVAHEPQACASSVFFPNFGVFYDLLLHKSMETGITETI